MSGALLEAFRHNNWATKELLASCRGLSEQQLSTAATGAYGDIISTLNHLIRADARYLRRLSGVATSWVDAEEGAGVDALERWTDEVGPLWEKFLSDPVDADRVIVIDDGVREVRAGVIVAQALHHGNSHREQVCTILTSLGVEPPSLQPWEYAEATGRMWETGAEQGRARAHRRIPEGRRDRFMK